MNLSPSGNGVSNFRGLKAATATELKSGLRANSQLHFFNG